MHACRQKILKMWLQYMWVSQPAEHAVCNGLSICPRTPGVISLMGLLGILSLLKVC